MSLADEHLSAITGKSFEYSGIFLPPGYLWENGDAVSRTTYARLFSVLTLSTTGNTTSSNATISSVPFDLTTLDHSAVGWFVSGPGVPAGATVLSFTANSITLSANLTATASGAAIVLAPRGVGDGITTFNLPDSRGRVSSGRDNMGGTAASRLTTAGGGVNGARLGAAAGAETHTLTTAQMPVHSHGVTDPTHNHPTAIATTNGSSPGGGSQITGNGTTTAGAAATGITIQNNGSGNAHPNVQPTIVKHKIIKT
jgi:microcystin-dependent protein